MTQYQLRLHLLSDTTFGRGDGVAGLADVEVQHDATGLPYLGGRTLKGLLGAECDEIVEALEPGRYGPWHQAADRLFGKSGSTLSGEAILRIGPACLPEDLRRAIAWDIAARQLSRTDVLGTLTTLRSQTAMNSETGAPEEDTLRTMRVILRGTVFLSQLHFIQPPMANDEALLAATVMALRHGGTSRNRGRGRLRADLLDKQGRSVTGDLLAQFRKAVGA